MTWGQSAVTSPSSWVRGCHARVPTRILRITVLALAVTFAGGAKAPSLPRTAAPGSGTAKVRQSFAPGVTIHLTGEKTGQTPPSPVPSANREDTLRKRHPKQLRGIGACNLTG